MVKPERTLPNTLYVRRLEAARLMGVSLSSVVRRINEGILPAIKVGGSVLIPYQAITALTPMAIDSNNTEVLS